ncbi:MAG: peptidase [Thermoplasmata archaeon]
MGEIRTAIPDRIDKYLDSLVRTGPFASKAELVRAALVAFAGVAGPIAQDFDKENMISPDGRIYQLEYAREGSMRGAPGVGIAHDDGVLLVGVTSPVPKLVKTPEKIKRIGERVAMLSSGIVSDARMLAHRVRVADPKTTDELVDRLAEFYWDHTIDRTKRPLCVALLVASALDGDARLLEFDPSGAVLEGNAAAIGEDCKSVREFLEKRYRRGSAKEAEDLALEALGKPETYDVVHVTA